MTVPTRIDQDTDTRVSDETQLLLLTGGLTTTRDAPNFRVAVGDLWHQEGFRGFWRGMFIPRDTSGRGCASQVLVDYMVIHGLIYDRCGGTHWQRDSRSNHYLLCLSKSEVSLFRLHRPSDGRRAASVESQQARQRTGLDDSDMFWICWRNGRGCVYSCCL